MLCSDDRICLSMAMVSAMMMMKMGKMRLVECAVIGDANLGIRSTPLAASSDSQMVKIFAF